MGGLVEDISTFSDPANSIGGENWYRQVAEHWVDASSRHGMPVDEQVYFDIKDDSRWSTYPASIAFKAAEFQGEDLGKRYLRSLRVAAAAQRRAIHRLDIQLELAGEVGLEISKFKEDMESGTAEKAFQEDLEECRTRGVRGFPSYLVQNFNGQEMLLRGYIKFETFETWLHELADGELIKSELTFGLTQVHDFIDRKGDVAPMEISVVFNIELPEAREFLKDLTEKGVLHEQEAGNGHLYSIPKPDSACDSVTGTCL